MFLFATKRPNIFTLQHNELNFGRTRDWDYAKNIGQCFFLTTEELKHLLKNLHSKIISLTFDLYDWRTFTQLKRNLNKYKFSFSTASRNLFPIQWKAIWINFGFKVCYCCIRSEKCLNSLLRNFWREQTLNVFMRKNNMYLQKIKCIYLTCVNKT